MKHVRLIFRVADTVVIIFPLLAQLYSLELIATTAGLIVCVLVLELVGSTCWGESFWWNTNCGRSKCSYSTGCGVRK